jgi:hypothetical protein
LPVANCSLPRILYIAYFAANSLYVQIHSGIVDCSLIHF